MNKLAFVVLAAVCVATPACAQAPNHVASDDPAPRTGSVGGGNAGQTGKGGAMKEAVQECRKQALAKGLTPGKELRQAVTDCVVKDHPGMADVMKCRMAGMDKGMKPGSSDMKSYVKDCAKKSGGA